jgi:hypothetical protein
MGETVDETRMRSPLFVMRDGLVMPDCVAALEPFDESVEISSRRSVEGQDGYGLADHFFGGGTRRFARLLGSNW